MSVAQTATVATKAGSLASETASPPSTASTIVANEQSRSSSLLLMKPFIDIITPDTNIITTATNTNMHHIEVSSQLKLQPAQSETKQFYPSLSLNKKPVPRAGRCPATNITWERAQAHAGVPKVCARRLECRSAPSTSPARPSSRRSFSNNAST
eukprot:74405-Pleurochrysis_carterae.AAC.3